MPVHVDERAKRSIPIHGQKTLLPAPSVAVAINHNDPPATSSPSYHAQGVYPSIPTTSTRRGDSPFQTRHTSVRSLRAPTIQTTQMHGLDIYGSSSKGNSSVVDSHGAREQPTPSGITNGSVPVFRVAPQHRNTGHFEAQRYRASIHPSDEAPKAPTRTRYRRRSSPPPYATPSASTSSFSLRSDEKSPDETSAESDINYVVFSATGDLEKTHICPHCLKRFNRPSSLQTHVNTHTGATRGFNLFLNICFICRLILS